MVVAKRRGTLAANMLFVVAVVLAIFGFHGVFGITVSPDLGMRNITSSQLIETVLMNKTSEIDESVADRNRRLIPYMTFYMPNDYDVNQHYNYIPEQQKQMIAFYQSQQPQQINIDQNPPQQKQPQSNRFQVRFPSNKPKYQAIVYGTRHQLSIPGKENAHHQGIPISYKESKLARPAHPYSSTTKVTPFAPSNKLPGHFTPIIYVHPTDNINYSRKPQGNHQYNEILNEQQNYQQDIRNDLQIPVSIYTTPKTPIFVSPSPRPLYINDNGQRPHQQLQPPMQFQQESSVNLTPQQKYVEYLKEQLRYKQRQYYQQQEPAYVVNASPPPPVANNILSYDKSEQMPINQIAYQPDIGPSGGESVGGSYQQPPPPQLIPYNHAPPAQPYDYNQSPSPRPPTYNNYPKYVEVIVQEPQQMMTAPPEKPIGFKQTVYVTTAAPIMVPSVSPIYKMEQSHRPIEIPKPTQSPRPFEIQPVEPSRSVYGPQIKYKLEKRPQFIHSPTPTPQIYRQHLTETTQVPPPILTTYHPDFISSKPIYRPNFSTVRPYKPKITQKYKPISVAKPIAQAITRPQPTPVPIENNNHYGNITHNSLADILHKLQESNELPKTFTPDNIDNSIRTLIRILNNLKQSQTIVEDPPQRHEDDYDDYDDAPLVDPSHPSPNSGRPGIDYPAYSEIPQTRFNCKEQRYKGFFGDPETHCQVWHYCDLNGGQASFLCPNGTIFSQVALTCDWWFNVKCSSTAQLYVLNERLYKYILPLTPKFPEDYSGPLVDKYLALKFKEMEEKMRREKTKGKSKSEEDDEADDDDEEEDGEEGGSQESEEIVPSTTTQSGEISENQSHGSDEERSRAAVIVTTTPVIPSLQSMPIVVTSTEEPELYSPSPPSVKTSVESEKVEVIEIKTDGTSGHLIPSRIFNSGLKK